MENVDKISQMKNQLRKFYSQKRLSLQNQNKFKMDELIYNKFINLQEYQESQKIFIYVSKVSEVDSWKIIKHSLQNKKIVCVPRCDTSQNTMNFYKINSIKDLKIGAYGIYEPVVSDKSKAEESFLKDLCVVPGLCYDKRGYRVGYGKGYYDKFLENFNGVKVGLCYSEFTQDELLHDDFDNNVDVLLTERYSLYTAKQTFYFYS